jgi:TonB family protein
MQLLISNRPESLLVQATLLVVIGTGAAWIVAGQLDSLLVDSNATAGRDVGSAAVDGRSPREQSVERRVELLLLNTQLAMAAEQYAGPADRSARHYLERAATLSPNDARVGQALDRLVDIVLQGALVKLTQNDFDSVAADLDTARELRPQHRMIGVVEQQLESARERAAALARATASARAVASRPAPPTRAPAPTAAEIRAAEERLRIEREAQRERELAARADALVAAARVAIEEGRLIEPEWQNARQHLLELAQLEADPVALASLRGAYLSKLLERAVQSTEAAEFAAAEGWIGEAQVAGASEAQLAGARRQLSDARFEAESNRIAALNEFEFDRYVPPRYPQVARQRGVEGWAEVRFRVLEDGRLTDIEVVDSERSANFRDAAVAAVRQWRMEPKTFEGRPLSQRVQARLVFRLGDE